MNRAVYPGTFDPTTNGHIDIIKRSLKIFDNITVLLANNSAKKTLFSLQERMAQLEKVIKYDNLTSSVKIDFFDGLLVDYCKEKKINTIIRGIRPLVDFDYEFEMAMTNRGLNSEVETIFILTDQKYFYLRSSLIKDLIKLDGDVSDMIPVCIKDELITKIKSI